MPCRGLPSTRRRADPAPNHRAPFPGALWHHFAALKSSITQHLTRSISALLLAILILAAIEASMLPKEVYQRHPSALVAAPALGIDRIFRLLYAPIAYHALLLLFVYVTPNRPDRPFRQILVHVGLSFALGLHGYVYITVEPKIAIYPPLLVALMGGLGALAYLGWSLRPRRRTGRRSYLHALHRHGPPLFGLFAFAMAHALNHHVLEGDHYAVHYSVLEVSFAFLASGLMLAADRYLSSLRWTSRVAAMVGLAIVFVVALGNILSGDDDEIAAHTSQYSLLGAAEVVIQPVFEGRRAGGRARYDPDGRADFERMAHMPVLPSSFNLADYNVLLVTSEAFRYDKSDLHLDEESLTPHLLRLAREGTSFQRAFAPSSATLLSNAAFMSMTLTSAAHVESWNKYWCGELLPEAETVAEQFRANGYTTFWIGHDYHHGFTANILGLDQGFDTVDLFPERSDDEGRELDAHIAARAVAELEQVAENGEPFFGWVYFASPHQSYLKHYRDAPGRTPLQRYRQELRYVDEQLGKLLMALEKTELEDNTVVIFTADHGEEFSEHGKRGHKTLFRESIHVPLVMRLPGAQPHVESRPTSTTYLLPWLMLHGPQAMRDAADQRIGREIGPMMRATDGAVVSEIAGRDRLRTVLIYEDRTLHYDLVTKLHRVYDAVNDGREKKNIYDPTTPFSREQAKLVGSYRQLREQIRNYSVDARRKPTLYSFHKKKKKKKKNKRGTQGREPQG